MLESHFRCIFSLVAAGHFRSSIAVGLFLTVLHCLPLPEEGNKTPPHSPTLPQYDFLLLLFLLLLLLLLWLLFFRERRKDEEFTGKRKLGQCAVLADRRQTRQAANGGNY